MIRRTALVALLVALAGCDSDGPLDVQPEPLLPLDVGAEWVFDYSRTFGFEVPTSTDTLRVAGQVSRDGVRWAELRGSTPRLQNCLGGFYAEIDGAIWYTPHLGGTAPYRLFARDAAYVVRGGAYDASVTLDRTDGTYAYTFDTERVRSPLFPEPGEFPVSTDGPDAIRVLEAGSGFVRYDQELVSFADADSLRIVAVDTYERRAFVPAE